MHLTRREWHAVVVGGLVAGPVGWRARAESSAVRLGAQSYSFRDRPLDAAIGAMRELGIAHCELWQGHVETAAALGNPDASSRREALRRWRLSVPLAVFNDIRARCAAAGIALTAYNISFRDDFTDEEIVRGFEMARALGVDVITASSNVTTSRRLDPVARRFGIRVGFHNHAAERPNEFRSPDDFRRALEGRSDLMAINLDIGHFTAANFDPVAFLDEHHDRIVSIHVKDRKRDDGANVAFGTGDTAIRDVLLRLRDRGWAFPANVEYEYDGKDTIAEVRRCLEYCREVLDGSQSRGWQMLFDGTSMQAWRGYKSDALPAGWSVADGVLSEGRRRRRHHLARPVRRLRARARLAHRRGRQQRHLLPRHRGVRPHLLERARVSAARRRRRRADNKTRAHVRRRRVVRALSLARRAS